MAPPNEPEDLYLPIEAGSKAFDSDGNYLYLLPDSQTDLQAYAEGFQNVIIDWIKLHLSKEDYIYDGLYPRTDGGNGVCVRIKATPFHAATGKAARYPWHASSAFVELLQSCEQELPSRYRPIDTNPTH